MKHTQGKWFVHKYNMTGYSLHHPLSIKSDVVSTRGNPTHIALLGTGTDERLANAKLISAAPDLLEACKMALDFLWNNEPKKKTGRSILHAQALYHTLESALAKAEGES